MIIIKLTGGLGNQLFQLAFGLSISNNTKEPLKFDLHELDFDPLRQYALEFLALNLEFASKQDIQHIKNGSYKERFISILGIQSEYFKKPFIKEQNFQYDNNFKFFRSKNVYFEGHWQSEKYFLKIKKNIKSIFSKVQYSDKLKAYLKFIETKTFVSIHYRRGDYFINSETNKFHGIPNEQYYNNALLAIQKSYPNFTILIFSDDKQWVKESLKLPFSFLIAEELNDHEELILMSKCKHNIIANSSFSWWGAWLNENPNKIVIAPKIWFTNKEMQSQTKDLIPESWIRI